MGAPRAPVMTTVTADVVIVRNMMLLENLVKDDRAIRRLILVGSQADEQVVDLLVDRRVVEKLRCALFGLRVTSAQDPERPKQIERLEADELRVPAAHRETRECPATRARLGAVGSVDDRDDLLPQFLLEERKRQLGVLRVAAVHDLVVRHDDDHRQRLAFGNQVVGDEAGAAVDVPGRRQFAAATEQVEHGISAVAVVVRRRVDIHLALAVEHVRVIDVSRDAAVRNGLGIVVRRAVAMNDDRAVARLVGKTREGVVRIDDGDAVDEELVDIEVGLQRADRQRPEAVGRLVEWDRRVALTDREQDGTTRQRDRFGVGRLEPERHRSIVANLRRDDVGAVRIQVLDVLVRVPVQIHVGLLCPRLV